jgi:hypothetical protein
MWRAGLNRKRWPDPTSWLRQAARRSGNLAVTIRSSSTPVQTKGHESSGLHLVKPRLVVEPKQAVDLLSVPVQPARQFGA